MLLINSKAAFWAKLVVSPVFAAVTIFSAAVTQDLIFHTSYKSSTASLRRLFFITLNSQWKSDVILRDYVSCWFCSLLIWDQPMHPQVCTELQTFSCWQTKKSINTHYWKYHLTSGWTKEQLSLMWTVGVWAGNHQCDFPLLKSIWL